MGFLKEKYTKEYFLKRDDNGNKLHYGATGAEEYLLGNICKDITDSLELIEDYSDKNILEIGYGRGESIKYFANKGAKSYYGIDFSEAAFELANENIMRNIKNENFNIYCDDALENIKTNIKKIKDRNINLVVMLDSIEHIPKNEMVEIFKLIDKLTKKGALFLGHTPFYEIDEDYCKNKEYIKPTPSDLIEETKGMHCNKYTKTRFYKELNSVKFFLYKSDRLFIKKDKIYCIYIKLKQFLQKIFYVKNINNHKVFNIFGIKIKIKKKKEIKDSNKIDNISMCKFSNNEKIKGENNKVFILSKNGKVKELDYLINNLDIEIEGNNNIITIPEDVNWLDSKISIYSNNNEIDMRYSNHLVKLDIYIKHGDNQKIFIDEYFSSGGCNIYGIEKDSKCTIGKDCMFSTDVTILSGDGHVIKDIKTDEVININNGINIGDHVWVGKFAKIIKNVNIPNNSVVGINSLVTQQFTEPNVIISGIPARIIKSNIKWERESVSLYK